MVDSKLGQYYMYMESKLSYASEDFDEIDSGLLEAPHFKITKGLEN